MIAKKVQALKILPIFELFYNIFILLLQTQTLFKC